MSGRAGDRPHRRYRQGVVRWVAAGVIVLALVAAVLPTFGADPAGDDGTSDAVTSAATSSPSGDPAGVAAGPSEDGTAATGTSGGDGPVGSPADTASGTTSPAGTSVDAPSLYGLIADDPQFSSVETAIEAAGLFDDLANGGPFTLFAPSNDAFDALDPAFAGAMNADTDLLESVLFHHAIDGVVPSGELSDGAVRMVDGSDVEVDVGAAAITLSSGGTSATITDADLVAANGVLHVIDAILIPPEVDSVVDADAAVAVTVDRGAVTLVGSVADDAQRGRLRDAVEESVDPANVDDTLTVDPASAGEDGRLADLAAVSARLPVDLVEGAARLAGEAIAVSGLVVDDDAGRRLDAAASGLETEVLVALEPRPDADSVRAGTIAAQVDELLADRPLLFRSGVSFADPDAGATLDLLAGLVKSADGLDIAIVGFTDTTGDAASNLEISLERAATVRDELVRRGVPSSDLTTAGFGENAPVVVDGAEDAAASRRVEIVVRLAGPVP